MLSLSYLRGLDIPLSQPGLALLISRPQALHVAARIGHSNVVSLLIEMGQSV